jgi:hypothetical protein
MLLCTSSPLWWILWCWFGRERPAKLPPAARMHQFEP